MKRLGGQAARGLWTFLHGTLAVAMTALLLGGVGLGVLAWRLAQGPIVWPWLTARIEAAVNTGLAPERLTIGRAALAWEGFQAGLGAPLDLRLTDVAVLDGAGVRRLAMPGVAVTLSLPALLRLRLVARTIVIERPRILLRRAADGTIGLDIGAPAEAPAETSPVSLAPESVGRAPPSPAPGRGSPVPLPGPATNGETAAAGGQGLTVAAVLRELARPAATEASPWRVGWLSQLHRVRVRGARLTMIDPALGAVWQAPSAEIDLVRAAGGGVDGRANLTLALGSAAPRLSATAHLPPDGGPIRLSATLSPVAPAALAASATVLAPLAALDAPLGGTATALLGPDLLPRRFTLHLLAGAGTARIAAGTVPILGATLTAAGTPERVDLTSLEVLLPGTGPGKPTKLTLSGTITRTPAGSRARPSSGPSSGPSPGTSPGTSLGAPPSADPGGAVDGAGQVAAALRLGFDQVNFADLARFWPAGLAADARRWVLGNIPAGLAQDGRFTFGLQTRADFSGLRLTEAAGTLRGTGVEVYWLRPTPPLLGGEAELRLLDPDRLEIDVHAGRQAPEPPGRVEGPAVAPGEGLVVRGGRVTISGLTHHDQDMRIEASVAGSIPAAVALLRDPRLGLLSRHKIPLHDPAGTATAELRVSLPLLKRLTMAQVAIGVTAQLSAVHLGAVVAGRDLNGGDFALKADTDGLTLAGTGVLGGIPLRLDGTMDFRAGPVGQVQQRVTATGLAEAKALAAAGVPTFGVVTGTVGVQAVATERRGGAGDVAVRADLTAARIFVRQLDWAKPAGQTALLTADLRLDHDQLRAIDPIRLTGAGAAAQRLDGAARATFSDGRLTGITLDRLALGGTEVHGSVLAPPGGAPLAVRVTGPVLDLAARFAPAPKAPGTAAVPRAAPPPAPPPAPQPAKPAPPGPAYTVEAGFATVRLAGGQTLTGLTVSAANDGRVFRRLSLHAAIGKAGTLAAGIAPAAGQPAGGRALTVRATDAGALAAGLGLPFVLSGGQLAVTGSYGPAPDAPLRGTAELDDFRLRDAPVLAKLLQAVTLYGLVEVLRGPGLGVSRLIAPFSLGGGVLVLDNARAFSPSLGVTAAGRIDLDRDRIDLRGTIVPAYFFNALLGHLPLVGRLFSPERGGGVFAASYALSGDLERPDMTVNPLAALTPGFLRDLFKLF